MRATSTFAHVAGGVLVAHGTLGFAVTGVSATPDAREALLGIGISPLVNLAHVGLGLALITATALGPAWARTAALVAAAVLATLGLLGLSGSATGGALDGANAGTTTAHLVLAGWATVANLRSTRRQPDQPGGPTAPKPVRR